MRIAVVSDIHGNRRAFDAVRKDLALASPDLVLHGGDLAANGAHPAEIIDEIRSLGWHGVRGNTDEMLWTSEGLVEFTRRFPKFAPLVAAFEEMIPVTRERIGEDRLRWLRTLPARQCVEKLILLHASPDDLWRAPLNNAGDEELESAYVSLGGQVVIYGHIHCPFVRRLSRFTVANTGSVSLSYDGDPRASYLLLDGGDIHVRRVDYDVESEADDLVSSGLPYAEWLCSILRSSRYCAPF